MCKVGYKARLKCEFTELRDYPRETVLENICYKRVRNIERQRENQYPEDVRMQIRTQL